MLHLLISRRSAARLFSLLREAEALGWERVGDPVKLEYGYATGAIRYDALIRFPEAAEAKQSQTPPATDP